MNRCMPRGGRLPLVFWVATTLLCTFVPSVRGQVPVEASPSIARSKAPLAGGAPALIVSPTAPITATVTTDALKQSIASISIGTSNPATPIGFFAYSQTNNQAGPDWLLLSLDGTTFSPQLTGSTGSTSVNLTVAVTFQGFAPNKTYTGSITIEPLTNSSSGPVTIMVTVNVGGEADQLVINSSPLALTTSPPNTTGTISVQAANDAMFFNATTTITTPPGGTWLQINQSSPKTNATVSVSAQAAGLGNGTYYGKIDLFDSANVDEDTLNVTLTVSGVTGPAITLIATPPSLTINSPVNGPPISQTINLASSSSVTPVNIVGVTDNANAFWDSGQWTAGPTPSPLTVTVTPAGLSPGSYPDMIAVTSSASNDPLYIPVTLNIGGPATVGTLQTISHVADGFGWRSTFILMNTDTVPAPYTVNYWQDGVGLTTPNLSVGSTSSTIPVGGSVMIRTADLNPNLTEGWAQVVNGQSIGGTAIFRFDTTGQEAAVPLLATGSMQLVIPFQEGSGLGLGVALANPSPTQTATVTETFRDPNGAPLAQRTLSLAPQTHTAFNPSALNTITGNGVVEYDSNTSIYGLGIRASGTAFTSLEAIYPQAPATKIISHIADGMGWRSSILLVNMDTVPANYSVNFFNEAGASFSPPLAMGQTSGTIPVGGSVIIETADSDPNNLAEGWAQVSSSQSVGGSAIFRFDTIGQEAAVPLLTSGGTQLEIPYEAGTGLALGVALANPNAQTATITETIRDANGNVISTRQLPTLAALGHTAFNPALSGLTGTGVVEYDSTVSIYALGIRFANYAFTSERAIYK